jgi:hypothetical protein
MSQLTGFGQQAVGTSTSLSSSNQGMKAIPYTSVNKNAFVKMVEEPAENKLRFR